MKNIGLMRCTTASAEHLTTEVGIKLRRIASPVLRRALRLAVKQKNRCGAVSDTKTGSALYFCIDALLR